MTTANNTTATATLNNTTTKFTAPGARLDVLVRNGKSGIAVFARTKADGQRAVLGCRSVFLPTNVEAARAHYEKLVADATKAGWTRKAGGGGVTASRFDAIPAPTALPVSTPLAAKTEKATPAAAAGPGKGKTPAKR
jgi:hypothetical protein